MWSHDFVLISFHTRCLSCWSDGGPLIIGGRCPCISWKICVWFFFYKSENDDNLRNIKTVKCQINTTIQKQFLWRYAGLCVCAGTPLTGTQTWSGSLTWMLSAGSSAQPRLWTARTTRFTTSPSSPSRAVSFTYSSHTPGNVLSSAACQAPSAANVQTQTSSRLCFDSWEIDALQQQDQKCTDETSTDVFFTIQYKSYLWQSSSVF